MKRNAIAGRTFAAWTALEANLSWWMREIVDQRAHGTTGELPAVRFIAEQASLQPLNNRAPFEQARELSRRVQRDAIVEVDTNRYGVPWRLIGEPVQVSVTDGELRVHHAGREVARHPELDGRRQVRCLPELRLGLQHLPGATQLVLVVMRHAMAQLVTQLTTQRVAEVACNGLLEVGLLGTGRSECG